MAVVISRASVELVCRYIAVEKLWSCDGNLFLRDECWPQTNVTVNFTALLSRRPINVTCNTFFNVELHFHVFQQGFANLFVYGLA